MSRRWLTPVTRWSDAVVPDRCRGGIPDGVPHLVVPVRHRWKGGMGRNDSGLVVVWAGKLKKFVRVLGPIPGLTENYVLFDMDGKVILG